MKKLLIITGFILMSLLAKSQAPGIHLYVWVRDSITLNDSTVTHFMKDTLVNTTWVNNLINSLDYDTVLFSYYTDTADYSSLADSANYADSSGYSDTSGVALNISVPGTTGSIIINDGGIFGSALNLNTSNLFMDGNLNTGLGVGSFSAIVVGNSNTGIGFASLADVTGGDGNTGIGTAALNSVTTGDYNTSLGTQSLLDITTGDNNIAIGRKAGRYASASMSNRLFINSLNRSNLLEDSTLSIIYGYQAATSEDQRLDLNANVSISESLTIGGGITIQDTVLFINSNMIINADSAYVTDKSWTWLYNLGKP